MCSIAKHLVLVVHQLADNKKLVLIDYLIKHPKIVIKYESFDIIKLSTKFEQLKVVEYFLKNKNPWNYDIETSKMNSLLSDCFELALEIMNEDLIYIFSNNVFIIKYIKNNNNFLYSKYNTFKNTNNF